MVASWLARVVDLVYPPRCVASGCGRRGAWLCGACIASIEPITAPCPRCALPGAAGSCPACARGARVFRLGTAAGIYTGPLRDAVHALKYGAIRDLAAPLGHLASAAYRARAPRPDIDVVTPVPSRGRRVASRGVDHARAIAVVVADDLGLPWDGHALLRCRATASQVGLDADARRRNVRGAFVAGQTLAGLRVLVVDDVLTTGATAAECAEAALAAGARSVDVCVVGRAAGGPGGSVDTRNV